MPEVPQSFEVEGLDMFMQKVEDVFRDKVDGPGWSLIGHGARTAVECRALSLALLDSDLWEIAKRNCDNLAGALTNLPFLMSMIEEKPEKPRPQLGKTMMPWGKYGPKQGDHRCLNKIPAEYLLWLYEKYQSGEFHHPDPCISIYLDENLNSLMEECPDWIHPDER